MPQIVLPLTVRDLASDDLYPGIWGWSDTHLAATLQAIERAQRGEVDFLAVCPPSGVPIASGGIDYAKPLGGATIWQLSVDRALRSCGIGTILIQALEERARARGLTWVEIGAEENGRPRALYERLGYIVSGTEVGSWDVEAPDGMVTRHEELVTLMRKQIA